MAKTVRAAASEHVFAVSVVTVAELLTGAKLGHHDERTVRRFFAQGVSRRIALDEPAAERAAELRATHKALRMPDALILATADLNGDGKVDIVDWFNESGEIVKETLDLDFDGKVDDTLYFEKGKKVRTE